MKTLLVLAALSTSTFAQAAPAGTKCVGLIIQEIVGGLESPCGTPRRGPDPRKEAIYFTYSDAAGTGPRYIKQENCGHDSSEGLGQLRIQYKSLPGGSCRILDIRDWPRFSN
ncbi:MAG: hypothetical protein ACXVCK_10730 [Bdellovibrionota bacterium]